MASILDFFSEKIGELFSGIGYLLSSPFVLLYNVVCWIIEKLMEAISGIGHLVTLPFIFLYNLVCLIGEKSIEAVSGIGHLLSLPFIFFYNLVCFLGVKLKEAISYTGDLIISPFHFLCNLVVSIWEKVKECPPAMINAMTAIWNKMKEAMSSVGDLLSSPFVLLHNLVSYIWGKVKESPEMIKTEIAKLWKLISDIDIGDLVSSIWVKMKGSFLVVWDFISEFLSSAWVKVNKSPLVIKIVTFIEDAVHAIVPYVKMAVICTVDWIKQHPYLSGFIALLVVFLVLCYFCPALFGMATAPVKMMVAPGTDGAVLIARAAFEAAPRVYFLALRAGSKATEPLLPLR